MSHAVPCRMGWASGRPCPGCDCGAATLPPVPAPLRCAGDTMLPCLRCAPGCPWYASPAEVERELSAWRAEREVLDDPYLGEEVDEPEAAPVLLLDDHQRAAVAHDEGPALCTAGAGSGKTRVLTERIGRIVYQGLAKPHEVLAVTFSRKAAEELRERVALRLGHETAAKLHVSTFHSLGLSLCREFAHLVGRTRRVTVWDERSCAGEMGAAWEEVVSGLPEEQRLAVIERHKKKTPVAMLLRALDRHKREPDPIEDVLQKLDEGEDRFLYAAAIYQYEESKRACDALDYDDLIWATTRMLLQNVGAREQVQARWRFVLVDEYQDTSRVQALMMRQICEGHRNIFVVGDDDQAIYRWRGAEPTNLLDFEADWPGASVYPLGRNYRSTPNVVDWAARSIEVNTDRRPKRIWSEADPGHDVVTLVARDARDEADKAIAWLVERLSEDDQPYREGAVLVRTRRQLLTLQTAAARARVPNQIVGALSWHQRSDARLVLAWLRQIWNPHDLDAATTMLKAWPGIGPKMLTSWRKEASVDPSEPLGAPLMRAAHEARQQRTRDAVATFLHALREAGHESRSHVHGCVERLYALTGLDAAIREQRGSADPKEALDAAAREEVRTTLLGVSAQRPEEGFDSVRALLDEVATEAKREREDADEGGRVTISTIHASKGLEWHAVVVAGVAENLLPFAKSLAMVEEDEDMGSGVSDERRLYYVACTRAKRRLLLSYPSQIDVPGKPAVAASPSRFLAESAATPPPSSPDKPKRKWSRPT